ncbi:hypothetical protein K504DRAFT_464510 [Pleomassaria siparia CBS 279.74]|uniref:Uncharacterized protein n=1 Tax=Pleomassaria siparia CBS 279.74 TaxID=1314801 RepID=A0A6G1KHN2_9PLEO|nr:hypothetical protein K504DRAFT_464510 [Pleomassaria siparia CBS 279.74]
MSPRRLLQPLSPLAGNTVGARYNYNSKTDDRDGVSKLEDEARDGGSESVVSDLTSLENDADDFDKLIIQHERDERRLNNALNGQIRPFRKARIHPRVALTMDNLERNEARVHDGTLHAKAHVKFGSPPSSGGSTRSDPAIQPPTGWGRKSRKQRDWLRTYNSEDEHGPGTQEDTIDRLVEEDTTPQRANGASYMEGVDLPVASVEDSPLSRKGSHAGTPSSTRRRDTQLAQIPDWDFTMDLNEASLIASTPYVPRNTNPAIEDIRQREIESLREQAVTTNRLDKIREHSPEETRRRPRSSSTHSTNHQTNGTTSTGQPTLSSSTSELRLHKRTNSWKTIGKSQAVIGDGGDQSIHSPVVVYSKSSETVGIVNRDLVANAPTSPQRPAYRREDSHDILRRLARVSSVTPSPGRNSDLRPQTSPTRQAGSSSQATASESLLPTAKDARSIEKPAQESAPAETIIPNSKSQSKQQTEKTQSQNPTAMPSPEPETVDVDATPMPVERSILNVKTPVVMGGWIDTPAPRTNHRPLEPSRSRSRSPRKDSPSKSEPQKEPEAQSASATLAASISINRPTLPGSALESIVEERRARGRRPRSDDFGDSTMNSLEDILESSHIAESTEVGGVDEDTLQGLQVPTGVPRTEAERQRQQELLHLHRMNERLRAARVSIRDASRGMKRVEDQVEHQESGTLQDGVRIVHRDCPCAAKSHQCMSPWTVLWAGISSLFRDPNEKNNWRWGLTWLSIGTIIFWTWFISEAVACDFYCHQEYAAFMDGYGVDEDAPKWPKVIPTLFYRTFMQFWWQPLWAVIGWVGNTVYEFCWADEAVVQAATKTTVKIARAATRTVTSMQETWDSTEPIGSIYDDEVI